MEKTYVFCYAASAAEDIRGTKRSSCFGFFLKLGSVPTLPHPFENTAVGEECANRVTPCATHMHPRVHCYRHKLKEEPVYGDYRLTSKR